MNPQTSILHSMLKEGVSENEWGYSLKRIALSLNKSDPMRHKIPYTFTTYGFKDKNKNWFVILRMNVDQLSPTKQRPFDDKSDIQSLWKDMMHEFVNEFVEKEKQMQQKTSE